MSELAELLERFRRGPELLAAVLTGAAGKEFDFQPAPGKWSIRQIMAHMADSEMVGATRFRFTIAEDNPTLVVYDQDLWATRLDYAQRKPSDCMETFRRIRRENYELLRALPEEAFQRSCSHPWHGNMTLLDLLRIYTEHAEKHGEQIMNARDAYRAAKASQ
jgi:hypothetical protein